jgi:hypothetical protein
MKTLRTFKGSWFFLAIVVAIIVGEVVAWEISTIYGARANPVTVAFLAIGLVAAMAMVLYDGEDIG